MIQKLLIQALLQVVLRLLDSQKAKDFVASLIGSAEAHLVNSATDPVLGPALVYLRHTLSLPDGPSNIFQPSGDAAKMIEKVVIGALGSLGTDAGKHFFDRLLDKLELIVHRSKTQLDDQLVLPLADFVRKTFSIPDYANVVSEAAPA